MAPLLFVNREDNFFSNQFTFVYFTSQGHKYAHLLVQLVWNAPKPHIHHQRLEQVHMLQHIAETYIFIFLPQNI